MILMYHKVFPESPTKWWVTANEFYRQMVEISTKEIVYLDDYEVGNENQVVITFDGVYQNILDYALPILEHFNYPFELFLTSDYIGKNNEFDSVEPSAEFTSKEDLAELVNKKGRLQWHTKSHINLGNVDDFDIIHKELDIPREILKLDKNGFKWFAYPHGEFNDLVLQEVKKKFVGAVSCNQGNDSNKYCLNRLTVTNDTKLNKSTVACIIASYNYGNYLIESIESVLRQTILPDQILISDDHSDDETELIARSYVEKYQGLIFYNRNDKNLGIVDHFNKAITLTDTNYVFFLGADNRLQSNYIEETKKILDANRKVGIAYTDFALFGSRAKITYQNFPVDWQGEILENIYYKINFPVFSEEQKKNLKNKNFIHGSSMFRRKAFNDVGGYIKSDKPEDHNLFKRIIEKNWLAAKPGNTFLEYRQHSLSQANNLVSIQNKMNFYKREMDTYSRKYKEIINKKSSFERSKLYRLSYFVYRGSNFLKHNYKNPKKIFRLFFQKLKTV